MEYTVGTKEYFRAKTELGRFKEYHCPTVMVFGEGPVKPVLLPTQLTPAMKDQWDRFCNQAPGPVFRPEPNFYVLDGASQEAIDGDPQQMARFALKRMGRLNALAAGAALINGLTDNLILTGGKTKPEWIKEIPDNWPSEGQLMRDVIVRRYGAKFQEAWGYPITSVIYVEDEATNTLENVTKSVNKFPHLFQNGQHVGVLTADHHVARAALIGWRFGITDNESYSAQQLLGTRYHARNKQRMDEMMRFMTMKHINPWLKELSEQQQRWITGLTDPQYLAYWIGYVYQLEDAARIDELLAHLGPEEQTVLHQLQQNGSDREAMLEYTKSKRVFPPPTS